MKRVLKSTQLQAQENHHLRGGAAGKGVFKPRGGYASNNKAKRIGVPSVFIIRPKNPILNPMISNQKQLG